MRSNANRLANQSLAKKLALVVVHALVGSIAGLPLGVMGSGLGMCAYSLSEGLSCTQPDLIQYLISRTWVVFLPAIAVFSILVGILAGRYFHERSSPILSIAVAAAASAVFSLLAGFADWFLLLALLAAFRIPVG